MDRSRTMQHRTGRVGAVVLDGLIADVPAGKIARVCLSSAASEPPHHPWHFVASRIYAPSQRNTIGPPFHTESAGDVSLM
jgi:hypothetical protein